MNIYIIEYRKKGEIESKKFKNRQIKTEWRAAVEIIYGVAARHFTLWKPKRCCEVIDGHR